MTGDEQKIMPVHPGNEDHRVHARSQPSRVDIAPAQNHKPMHAPKMRRRAWEIALLPYICMSNGMKEEL